jgi:hypothetical protein
MAYPRADRLFALIVDAPTGPETVEGGMGAILTQIDKKGKIPPISYESKQLIKQKKIYSPVLGYGILLGKSQANENTRHPAHQNNEKRYNWQ